MVEYFVLRRLENSKCFSLAMVRKASRPSIISQGMGLSGSTMGLKEAALWAECNLIVKKTSRCFSMVAKTLAVKSPVLAEEFFFLVLRLADFFFFWFFFLPPFLPSALMVSGLLESSSFSMSAAAASAAACLSCSSCSFFLASSS